MPKLKYIILFSFFLSTKIEAGDPEQLSARGLKLFGVTFLVSCIINTRINSDKTKNLSYWKLLGVHSGINILSVIILNKIINDKDQKFIYGGILYGAIAFLTYKTVERCLPEKTTLSRFGKLKSAINSCKENPVAPIAVAPIAKEQ